MTCTSCNSTNVTSTTHHAIYTCDACGGLLSTGIYRGDVFSFVHLHRWHTGEERPEDLRYFDFTILGSEGISRSHGWFHAVTKDVVQFG